MAPPAVAVKRSFTVRKIAPRKTTAPSDHDKENTPGRASVLQKKPKVSTPGHGSSPTKKKAAMPSPILPSTPPPASRPPQEPAQDAEDAAWSRKVRRSYSRLSSPETRETMFGFEKLTTPEVFRRAATSKDAALELSGSLSGLNSFTSLLEADDGGGAFPEPDPNIPGVAVMKERRRRRRKAPLMDATELDAMAAKMNAEFEEAEEFELVVE